MKNKVKEFIDANGNKNGWVEIYCPGCKQKHNINIDQSKGRKACWKFNGDLTKPTFSPSLLIRQGHYVSGSQQPPNCPCCNYKDEKNKPWPWPCVTCHSFIKDGSIQFLNDCTHALAGKTVMLPELDLCS